MSAFVERWDALMRYLREYHQYEVIGGEHVPQVGPALVASTHSLATYENLMMGSLSLDELGRRPYIVGDHLMFKIPWLGAKLREVGMISGDRELTVELLKRGEIVGLGPGGMREALRPSHDKYRFDWSGRLGFVKVSILAQAPIIVAACPAADDIFTVYKTSLTPWLYRAFKVPLPIFRGRGLSPLPRPVKLVHWIAPPILPPKIAPSELTDEHVSEHHAVVCERMMSLVSKALASSSTVV
jgi:1-acyl-sn-glycerol-3-phosphate acyltransferase